jgi:hypothetical protein
MTNWSAGTTAIAAVISAGGIGFLAFQVTEARRTRGVAEVATYNDTKARMDAQAPRVEVDVGLPEWPPLGASPTGGTPQPWPPAQEWHFPRGQDHQLLLQAQVRVTNRSESTVHVKFEGDLWEADTPDGRPRKMRSEMLLGPNGNVTALLRGGLSLQEWAQIDALAKTGQELAAVVRATITAHDDADEGVVDVWHPWLTGTPVAEDPTRGSVWMLTPPPLGGEHGDWCLQYNMQPVRRRTYWLARGDDRPLPAPPERPAK